MATPSLAMVEETTMIFIVAGLLFGQGIVCESSLSDIIEPTPSALSPPSTALSPPSVTSVCSCLCNSAAVNRPRSAEEASVVAEEHKQEVKGKLIVNTKNLSSTVNKKESALDVRPSSTYMGFLGIFILSFVIGSLVLLDVPRLVVFLKSLKAKAPPGNENKSREEVLLKGE